VPPASRRVGQAVERHLGVGLLHQHRLEGPGQHLVFVRGSRRHRTVSVVPTRSIRTIDTT